METEHRLLHIRLIAIHGLAFGATKTPPPPQALYFPDGNLPGSSTGLPRVCLPPPTTNKRAARCYIYRGFLDPHTRGFEKARTSRVSEKTKQDRQKQSSPPSHPDPV